ncbi:MAG TPA: hypothetical protein VLT16_19095 [Candidatus Limnocylindrales bacterium]|nr:hypothetical protein [Candidatus Limnocylindrales bacterium]
MSRKRANHTEPDRLISELGRVEKKLQAWIESSRSNAELFRRDPLGAMRAAGLMMEDDIMLELEMVLASIARKLR